MAGSRSLHNVEVIMAKKGIEPRAKGELVATKGRIQLKSITDGKEDKVYSFNTDELGPVKKPQSGRATMIRFDCVASTRYNRISFTYHDMNDLYEVLMFAYPSPEDDPSTFMMSAPAVQASVVHLPPNKFVDSRTFGQGHVQALTRKPPRGRIAVDEGVENSSTRSSAAPPKGNRFVFSTLNHGSGKASGGSSIADTWNDDSSSRKEPSKAFLVGLSSKTVHTPPVNQQRRTPSSSTSGRRRPTPTYAQQAQAATRGNYTPVDSTPTGRRSKASLVEKSNVCSGSSSTGGGQGGESKRSANAPFKAPIKVASNFNASIFSPEKKAKSPSARRLLYHDKDGVGSGDEGEEGKSEEKKPSDVYTFNEKDDERIPDKNEQSYNVVKKTIENMRTSKTLSAPGTSLSSGSITERKKIRTVVIECSDSSLENSWEGGGGGVCPRRQIPNIGNSCYMNSVFNALSACDGVVQCMRDAMPHLSSQPPPLLLTTEHIMRSLVHGSKQELNCATMNRMRNLMAHHPIFGEGEGKRQQDAHEFLTFVLDVWNEYCTGKKSCRTPRKSGGSVPRSPFRTLQQQLRRELTPPISALSASFRHRSLEEGELAPSEQNTQQGMHELVLLEKKDSVEMLTPVKRNVEGEENEGSVEREGTRTQSSQILLNLNPYNQCHFSTVTRMVCNACSNTAEKKEWDIHLQLGLPTDMDEWCIPTLEELLLMETRTQHVTDFTCDHCGERGSLHMQTLLDDLHEYLIIVQKRFTYETRDEVMKARKICSRVHVPLRLCLDALVRTRKRKEEQGKSREEEEEGEKSGMEEETICLSNSPFKAEGNGDVEMEEEEKEERSMHMEIQEEGVRKEKQDAQRAERSERRRKRRMADVQREEKERGREEERKENEQEEKEEVREEEEEDKILVDDVEIVRMQVDKDEEGGGDGEKSGKEREREVLTIEDDDVDLATAKKDEDMEKRRVEWFARTRTSKPSDGLFSFRFVDDRWQKDTCKRLKMVHMMNERMSTVQKTLPYLCSFTNSKRPATISIEGDGNCLFRCLSWCVTGTDTYHGRIRHLLLDFEREHAEQFKGRCDAESVEQHIERMRGDGEWGTQCELFAAATFFGVDVYTYMKGNRKAKTQWRRFHSIFRWKEGSKETEPIPVTSPEWSKFAIYLYNEDNYHYDVVRTAPQVEQVFSPDSIMYTLQSVVVHHGVFSTAGHYTALVHDTKKAEWLQCDDSTVKKKKLAEVLDEASGSGYILIYRREKNV